MIERILAWIRKNLVVHPLVFAAFPVLSFYLRNVARGFLRDAVTITICVLVLAVLLWLLAYLVMRNKEKSAVVVSAFFVLFFSYGQILSALGILFERAGLVDKLGFLIYRDAARLVWVGVLGVLFAIACYLVVRARDLRQMTTLLNVVALALVVMLGVNGFTSGGFDLLSERVGDLLKPASPGQARGPSALPHRLFFPLMVVRPEETQPTNSWSDLLDPLWQTSPLPEPAPAQESLPDIYYIILDMYPRADYLASFYHYDESAFLSFLTSTGFYVASESTANYPRTVQSLASSLNFTYLNEIAAQARHARGHGLSVAMISDNRLFRILHDRGYTTIAFTAGYDFTEIAAADRTMEPPVPYWLPNEFQRTLFGLTPLSTIPILRRTEDSIHRERILYAFDHIADAVAIDGPTFVFAHLNSPHAPYVFGPRGESVPSRKWYARDEYIEAYRNQVAFLDIKVEQLVEEILAQSPEPPIIILQGDHGDCYGYDCIRRDIAQRMAILNAYYFPDQDYTALYRAITPVNTFRVVLNDYLGTDYALLEDRNYYSSDDDPYVFIDVTDKVQIAAP